jgi:ankyrin repeat protein
LSDNAAERERRNAQGMAPIGFASLHGHTPIVRALAARGASTGVLDQEGHTLLHLACSNGHMDTARALVELGSPTTALDAAGRSAFHVACGSGHLEVATWWRQWHHQMGNNCIAKSLRKWATVKM